MERRTPEGLAMERRALEDAVEGPALKGILGAQAQHSAFEGLIFMANDIFKQNYNFTMRKVTRNQMFRLENFTT